MHDVKHCNEFLILSENWPPVDHVLSKKEEIGDVVSISDISKNIQLSAIFRKYA